MAFLGLGSARRFSHPIKISGGGSMVKVQAEIRGLESELLATSCPVVIHSSLISCANRPDLLDRYYLMVRSSGRQLYADSFKSFFGVDPVLIPKPMATVLVKRSRAEVFVQVTNILETDDVVSYPNLHYKVISIF